jgi:hypothetical protein
MDFQQALYDFLKQLHEQFGLPGLVVVALAGVCALALAVHLTKFLVKVALVLLCLVLLAAAVLWLYVAWQG